MTWWMWLLLGIWFSSGIIPSVIFWFTDREDFIDHFVLACIGPLFWWVIIYELFEQWDWKPKPKKPSKPKFTRIEYK